MRLADFGVFIIINIIIISREKFLFFYRVLRWLLVGLKHVAILNFRVLRWLLVGLKHVAILNFRK